MKAFLLAGALAVGLALPGQASAEEVQRRAVIVGVNDGGTLLDKLQYAEEDARRFAGVLRDLGGFDVENTQLLVAPTADDLLAALASEAEALEKAEGETLFLFYYSGHADEIGLQLAGQHVPYEDLKAAIRQVPADVHLGVLDACRSGAITKVKGASIAEPFLQEALAAEGEAWIAASAATEDAQESQLLRGSFFTYYLTSGLRGAADTGDGWVSLNEAYNYAYLRTVARTAGTEGGTQHPVYDFQMQGNGDLKLTEVRRASARLRLPTDLAGEVAVLRLPENTPIAEVAKVEGQVVTLAIEPGTYLLRRRVDGGVQEVTLSVSEGSDLEVDRWSDTEVEVASLKGASHEEPDPTVFSLPVRTDGEQLEIRMRDEWRPVDFTALEDSPAVAGSLSIVPGLGHAYNGHWGTGALFLSSTIALHSVGWASNSEGRGSLTGPNALTFLAFAVHGWAISDAVWRVHHNEDFAPKAGVTLSAETMWGGNDVVYPSASGIAADWFANPHLSIGLDRTGFVLGPDENRYFLGTRITMGPTWPKWRLAAIGGVGMVVVHDKTPEDDGGGGTQQLLYPTDSVLSLSAGVMLRRYLTPRYFVQAEARSEWLDGVPHGTVGLGLGFHIGR